MADASNRIAPRGLELWQAGYDTVAVRPGDGAALEAAGWDGKMAMDSQSLAADPYVVLSALAVDSAHLKLGTSVTNPYTRHPAVTAAAMVSLQALSRGRAVLGIGRGDSSLAYLGRAPLSVEAFERCLSALQSYLRGEAVPFEALDWSGAGAPSLETIELGRAPEAAQLRWIPEDLPKVPLDVAATGPRVIAAAARRAERVTLGVGAAPERVAWAVDIARKARADSSIGAQVIVMPHPDPERARRFAAGLTASLARFSTLNGRTVGPASPAEFEVFENLRAHYDMNQHGRAPEGVLTADFVDRFAVVGTPDHCVDRLARLVELGITRFVICGPLGWTDPAEEQISRDLLTAEVLPALRKTVAP
ncbi:MAG: LLM class flavin-dependent oxidoreductase [bacterium]|nr:LLM class flavin-dependent oxidoreductase [bacterium]